MLRMDPKCRDVGGKQVKMKGSFDEKRETQSSAIAGYI